MNGENLFSSGGREPVPMEELRPDSLSPDSRNDPATLAAWAQATTLEGRPVFDVNGLRLGRVTKCFAEEGVLARCDLTLSANAKGILGVETDVAPVPTTWISRVDDEGIRLLKAGEQVVRPDDPRPLGAEHDEGAKGKPRKVR